MHFRIGIFYSCDARSRIASCGARARSRTVEFSVQGVKSVWITYTGVSRVLIAIALKCALMMKCFARAREMAWHAVNGVVDGYYGVSLGYLRNLEVGL